MENVLYPLNTSSNMNLWGMWETHVTLLYGFQDHQGRLDHSELHKQSFIWNVPHVLKLPEKPFIF